MGNTSSFETQLADVNRTINIEHYDIDQLMEKINNEANRLIALIMERNYTDRQKVCEQLGWQKVDELSSFFEVQTLNGIRYRLGIVPQDSPQLESSKRRVCVEIVNFYLKKINLITSIQRELPKCKQMESDIYNGLSTKLKAANLNDQEWLAVYNKVERYNSEIKDRYKLFERELERIRKAKNMQELDNIAATVNGILANTDKICMNYQHELAQYASSVGRVASPEGSPQLARVGSPPVIRQTSRPVSPRVATVVISLSSWESLTEHRHKLK